MFNIEFKLQGNTVIQVNSFIPRESLVRITVKPDRDIRNVKLNIKNKEYYLLKDHGVFGIDITKDMMVPGKNTFNFTIQGDITSNTNNVEIELTKNNIKQTIHSDLDILNAKLNKITSILEER